MPSKAPLPSAAALLCAALLIACAPLPPTAPAASGDVVAPNRNLVVQGIPPMPRRIADEVARYTDFRGHRFVDWHPLRSEMLVSTRKAGGDTTQIFRLAAPLAEPEQLTDFSEPVRTASYEPTRGDYIVFERCDRRRRGGAALPTRPGDTADDACSPRPASATTCRSWLHRSSQSALPLAAARSHRAGRQPQRGHPDALAGRPDAAAGATSSRRAARRRLGSERRSPGTIHRSR